MNLSDILMIPISGIILIITVKTSLNYKFSLNKIVKYIFPPKEGINFVGLLGVLIFPVLGIGILYLGLTGPLDTFTSIKGDAHGYTLIHTGLSLILMTSWFFFEES